MKVNIERITIDRQTRSVLAPGSMRAEEVFTGFEVEVEYNINHRLRGTETLELTSERQRGFETIKTLEDRLKDIILDALCDNPESVNVVMP